MLGRNLGPTGFFHSAAHLVSVLFLYAAYVLPILGNVTVLPAHDGINVYMPDFIYHASSLRFGYGFAMWNPSFGGVPVGITSLTLFHFSPHRLVGYLLYSMLPLDMGSLYKLNLVVGMMLVAAGWWLFLFRLWGSRASASIGCLMVLLGGTGFTIFHQEQILSTMTWTPWLLLAILAVKKDIRYIPVVAVLLGFSMTMHYPQIHILAFLFLAPVLAVTGKLDSAFLRNALRRKRLLALSAVLFVVSAWPSVYVSTAVKDFSSPVRMTEDIDRSSLDDYLRLNLQLDSSASVEHLENYVTRKTDVPDDQFIAYVTLAGLILSLIGIIARFRKALPVVLMLAFCVWAALGINAYLPQILFTLKFPFIQYFRQWYHFMPFVNFGLSALGALGFAAVSNFLFARRWPKAGTAILAFVMVAAMLAEGKGYMDSYARNKLVHVSAGVERLDEKEYLDYLGSGQFAWMLTGEKFHRTYRMYPMLTYTEWYRLASLCRSSMASGPFLATSVLNTIDVPQEKMQYALQNFCSSGLSKRAALADIPLYVSEKQSIVPLDNVYLGDLSQEIEVNVRGKNVTFQKSEFAVTPDGVSIHGHSTMGGLLVFPFAHKLGFIARVNQRNVGSYSAYGDAYTAVHVPPGDFQATLSIPFSQYQLALIMQALILVAVSAYSLRMRSRIE